MIKPCEHCKKPLDPNSHAGRKYHAECARLVNLAKGTARQRAMWAAKREEKKRLNLLKPKLCWCCGKPSEESTCDACVDKIHARNKARQLEANKKPKPVAEEPKPVNRDDWNASEQFNRYPVGGRSGLPAYQGV